MLSDALSYPRQHEHWLKTILIGGVLQILSFLIIPAFIVQGYGVRVLRSAARGEETLPTFDEWGTLLVDGLKIFAISLTYVLIPYILLGAGLVLAQGAASGMSLVGTVLMVGGGVLVLGSGYILPAALTNFALTGSVRAAFDISLIASAAFTTRYFIALVLALVAGLVLGIIAGLLTLILVGFLLLFYLQIVVYYLYGQGCGPTLRQQTAEPSTPQ